MKTRSDKEEKQLTISQPVISFSNSMFFLTLSILGASYVVLILAMLSADFAYMVRETGADQEFYSSESSTVVTERSNPIVESLSDPKVQYSIWLSMTSCTFSALLSLLVAVPMGYLMSRYRFPGHGLVDAILDIPIVLPPLVVGLSLLILFQFPPFAYFAREVVYQVPAVIVAQFSVACAFSVRTMKSTFDHINPRCEQVAISLGCSKAQAFGGVVLPEARRGILTAFTLAWARSLGEFGPLLIFAGATRMKTEVLSTTVFLEMNVGNLQGAVAVSLIMVFAAVIVLVLTRVFGQSEL
ncbi:Sulfate transport system permease protein CysW [Thalassoglobus neptunius]|uniref:Sulfate transport system permease protein CysW n=1 Tax=Thalassoglobus neptunius TaxID=1938619 RepID=A0A5C5W620_9PLAN|nr:ABC transporter permease [Thalassoglobus neptunius]TWT46336.1 Sulfate transport system permease protein CysW [Thalassoglobus neptunius]